MRIRRWLAGMLLVAAAAPSPSAGDLVRVVIERREPIWPGHEFALAGGYEIIEARLYFVFDPDDPRDANVVDLALAPRNSDGLVEVEARAVVLQPIDQQRRRGVAWIDLDSWGVGPAAPVLEAALAGRPVPTDALADGLLLDEGITLLHIVTEPGGLPRVQDAEGEWPAAAESDGGEVIGWVRREWAVDESTTRLPLDGPGGWHHPVAMPDAPVHRLAVRDGWDEPADSVPASEWDFERVAEGDDATAIVREGDFEAGRIYELVYRARAPRLEGLALPVLRDVMAYARYDVRSEFPADHGVVFGSGVGARMLRSFLRDGFNDAGGRIAFDAVWMHGAGAGRGDLNRRFAQPYQSRHFVDLYPFTLGSQFDPVTGRSEGLLDRLSPETTPYTVATHVGGDYHTRGAALTHTTVDGLRDLLPEAPHRAWHLASVGAGVLDPDRVAGPDPRSTLRALSIAVVRWVMEGDEPPGNRLPSVGAGTLVGVAAVASPRIGGGELRPDPRLVHREDHGPRFLSEGIADLLPPEREAAFPALLPQVDGFGNELGGVRGVELRVPLATYLPWGEAHSAATDRASESETVTVIPLALTADGRDDDPRPALQSLYGSEAGFLARARAASSALVEEGFLLERDRAAVIASARERWLSLMTPNR